MGEPNLFSNPNAYEDWVMRQREANNAAARNRNREHNIAWAEHTRRFAEQPVRKNEVNQTHRREYEERFTGLAPEEPSAKEIEHMRFIRSLEERQVQVKPQLQHEEFIPNNKPKNKPSRFQRFTQKLKNIKNSVSRRFGFSKKQSPERMRLINSTSKALTVYPFSLRISLKSLKISSGIYIKTTLRSSIIALLSNSLNLIRLPAKVVVISLIDSFKALVVGI